MIALQNAITQMAETTIQNASLTVTANSTGLDVSDYEGVIAVSLRVASITGTPTLDTAVKHSATSGGSYAQAVKTDGTNAIFTQFAAAGGQRILIDTNGILGFLRLEHTVGGGSPVLNVTAFVTGVKKVIN